jgi:hypothetical protein
MNDARSRHLARTLLLGAVLGAAILAAGCGAAAGPATTPASPAPATPTPPVPSPTSGAVLTEQEAVAKVLALDPRFAGIGPLSPDLIGQSAWYEVSPATVGWRVTITQGWGDCQAGCINRHTWTYDVDPRGVVTLVSEGGDPLDEGAGGDEGGAPESPPVAIPADGGPWIAGRALAGPTCPVEQNPPDPACAERPVAGAEVVVRDGTGAEVARAVTAADGTFLVAVPGSGVYSVEAQPTKGILGTPAALLVDVGAGPLAWAVALLAYDTGIR